MVKMVMRNGMTVFSFNAQNSPESGCYCLLSRKQKQKQRGEVWVTQGHSVREWRSQTMAMTDFQSLGGAWREGFAWDHRVRGCGALGWQFRAHLSVGELCQAACPQIGNICIRLADLTPVTGHRETAWRLGRRNREKENQAETKDRQRPTKLAIKASRMCRSKITLTPDSFNYCLA